MENDQKYSSSIALCMIEEKGHDFDLLRMEFKKILSSEDLSHAEKNTVTLLIKVIAVPFFPENPIEPYLLRYIDDDQYRSDHPFEFSKDDIEYLVSIASTFRNDIFKARVNDLIWFCIKKGNIVHADIAIDSYLASAFNRPATEWRSYTKQELERGYRLAKGINRTDKIQKIKKYLLDMLTTTEETDINLFFAIALFSEETGLLTDEKPDVISQIQRVADNLFNNSNFDLAIRYYELCARLYPSADVKTRVAMLMRSAECYECHARNNPRNGNSPRISNSRDRVNQNTLNTNRNNNRTTKPKPNDRKPVTITNNSLNRNNQNSYSPNTKPNVDVQRNNTQRKPVVTSSYSNQNTTNNSLNRNVNANSNTRSQTERRQGSSYVNRNYNRNSNNNSSTNRSQQGNRSPVSYTNTRQANNKPVQPTYQSNAPVQNYSKPNNSNNSNSGNANVKPAKKQSSKESKNDRSSNNSNQSSRNSSSRSISKPRSRSKGNN